MKSHKLILLIPFTLLLSTKTNGQPTVDISFTATIPVNLYNQYMSVGLDFTATNCIDPQLGEAECPPCPPGVPDIRLSLDPYGCPVTVWKDYRPAYIFPYTGTVEHLLVYQLTDPSPIIISYNLPVGAYMSFTDLIGGIILNLGPFQDRDQ